MKFKVRTTIFFAAILFIVIGITREEHLVVMKKAVNICL
jgi:hypothetical protein